MQAVILNGARPNDDATDHVHDLIAEELWHTKCEAQSFTLRDAKIAYCQGDFECWVKTPGMCKAADDSRAIARAVINSDLVIYLTPITFGGYSSELKRALDKMICLIAPFFAFVKGEVHHQKRYERYPRLVGIGTLTQPDKTSERIFATLVSRNAINMHSPAQAACAIVTTQSTEQIQSTIRAAFAAVGVKA
jgi:multimeric flavodoxin WrbA